MTAQPYSSISTSENGVLSLWPWMLPAPVRLPSPPMPSMRAVAEAVAAKHGLTLEDLIGRSRIRSVAWPRQEAIWEVRRQTDKSLTNIGRFFNRDHTTVIHSCAAHASRMKAPSTGLTNSVGAAFGGQSYPQASVYSG
jgi:hypothetical protein